MTGAETEKQGCRNTVQEQQQREEEKEEDQCHSRQTNYPNQLGRSRTHVTAEAAISLVSTRLLY